MKILSHLLAPAAFVLVLSACSEPQQPAPATQQPAETAAVAEAPVAAAPVLPRIALLDAAAKDQALVVAGECNIESAAEQPFAGESLPVGDKSKLKFTGWMKSGTDGAAIIDPALRIESADKAQIWQQPVQLTINRDDVAANGAAAGFELAIDASDVPAGNYHLYLVFKNAEGLGSCDNGRRIDLK
ncbi:MAG: hypothetical protein JNM58_09880 [Xanthomonadaceae bacterium]|nr:hypothetical protein [Xanthomonadaceae bacterium]